MRDEFESTFDGKILKLESSQLQRIYDIQKSEAAVVFVRKGVGLLYPSTDPDKSDDIFDFFNDNREPIVKELDDSSFEHLTQASSGATTGDWLVQFYDNTCVDCNRLTATWETVGAKLKTRMNVARVNRGTKGIDTAKRFKVQQVPEFILLRQGKFYRYNLKKYDVETFVGFATSWYNRVAAEKVIAPSTPFENIVELVVLKLKAMPKFTNINDNPFPLIVLVSIVFLPLFIFLMRREKSPPPPETKKPEKKTATKKD